MKIKVFYEKIEEENEIDNEKKAKDEIEESDFETCVGKIISCALFSIGFYKNMVNEIDSMYSRINTAFNQYGKPIFSEIDFDNLHNTLTILCNKGQDVELLNELGDLFKRDFMKIIDSGELELYVIGQKHSRVNPLINSNISYIRTKLSTYSDVRDMVTFAKELYMSNDLQSKQIVTIFFGSIVKKVRNEYPFKNLFDTLRKMTGLLKELEDKIRKGKPIDYSLMENFIKFKEEGKIMVAYGEDKRSIDVEKTFPKKVFEEYNALLIKEKERIENLKAEYKNATILATESSIANYTHEYNDVGDIELTDEEKDCVEIYLDIITKLKDNELETFENKTPDYLEALLDGDPYPTHVINSLIEKINESDSIDEGRKKKICRIVKHLI